MNADPSDLAGLQAFLIDNPDFDQLEALLAEFNIFETLGAVNVELRHSEFLAYLFDPQQNHGLTDAFIKRLLQTVLLTLQPDNMPVRPIDLELWDLDDLEVRREWQGIDILLISERNHFVVTIENKIYSGEHSDQLNRYRHLIEKTYADWAQVFLFLTPEGDIPSDEEHYLPVSYRLVVDVLDKLAKSRQSSLGPDVLMLLRHYIQMLRRYIVNDEIAELCRKIYRKHKKAIDLIVEYIPSRQASLKELLDQLIKETNGRILPDRSRLSEVAFVPKDWDTPVLRQGEDWSIHKRILLFYIENRPDRCRIVLSIGPGKTEVRQKLLDIARAHKPPFRSAYEKLNPKWNSIYNLPILEAKDFERMEYDEMVEKIKAAWAKFLSTDLRQMEQILKQYPWIWEE